MGYIQNNIRNLNILDKNIQKKLQIENLEKQINGNLDGFIGMYEFDTDNKNKKIAEIYQNTDIIEDWLYQFTLNGIIYYEYIRKKIYENGNSETVIIDILEKGKEKPILIEEFILQGGECPKCHESHFIINNKRATCSNCGYEGKDKDFYYKF